MGWKRVLNPVVTNRIGKTFLSRGYCRDGDESSGRMFMWDVVDNCNPNVCKVAKRNMCYYEETIRSRNHPNPKCRIQIEYARSFYEVIQSIDDQELLYRIGMLLMPQLMAFCKMKMLELTLKSPLTEKGTVHPVYAEIRAMAREINKMWEELGLDKLGKPIPDVTIKKGRKKNEEDDDGFDGSDLEKNGTKGFHEALMGEKPIMLRKRG